MGLHIRDDRQMKALTGWSQDQCDHVRPFCRALYATPQHTTDAVGVASGTRRRQPGGGATGPLPTLAAPWPCGLSDSKTSPPLAVLGTPLALARSPAHAPRHHFSPRLDAPLVQRARLPSREWSTPEAWPAAGHGGERLLLAATARA
jgi:hypothetical protein